MSDALERAVDRAARDRDLENARKQEREVCAQIVESFESDYGAEVAHLVKRIARIIRRQR